MMSVLSSQIWGWFISPTQIGIWKTKNALCSCAAKNYGDVDPKFFHAHCCTKFPDVCYNWLQISPSRLGLGRLHLGFWQKGLRLHQKTRGKYIKWKHQRKIPKKWWLRVEKLYGPRSSRSFLYHWWSHCRFDTNQHQSKDGVGKVWYLRDFTLWCLEIMSPQNHRCQLLGWFVGIPILWFDSVSLLGFLLPVRPTAACARSFIRRSCSFFSAWAQDWSQSSKVEAVTEKPDIDFRGKSAMISCRCSKPNDYPPVN